MLNNVVQKFNTVVPKDLSFWLYHGGAISALVILQMAISFIARGGFELFLFSFFAMTTWSFAFTISVLGFRYCYIVKQWHDLPITKLILIVIGLAIAFSHYIFYFMSLLTLPEYWSEIYAIELRESPNISETKLFFKFYLSNIIATCLYTVAWVFLYLGITNARSAKESQLDNLNLQNSLKEAQLSGLSNQLNPHFLFNSLNNIRFMIHENADQADNMITSLSEVLRYSLESSEHEKRPLSQEVQVILNYIDIVNIQYEERLQFSIDINDELMNLLVPPMMLQLLIENAVKHGLEHLQEGGSIALSATTYTDSVEFTVVNDIPQEASLPKQSTGIGLKNIQQRLALLYGSKAGIKTDNFGKQFRVRINLPR